MEEQCQLSEPLSLWAGDGLTAQPFCMNQCLEPLACKEKCSINQVWISTSGQASDGC